MEFFLHATQPLIMARDRIADFFHAGDDLGCVAALLFAFGNFLTRRVAIGFPLLHFREQRAAFFVQADNFIHIGVMMTIFQIFPYAIGIFTNPFDIQHNIAPFYF